MVAGLSLRVGVAISLKLSSGRMPLSCTLMRSGVGVTVLLTKVPYLVLLVLFWSLGLGLRTSLGPGDCLICRRLGARLSLPRGGGIGLGWVWMVAVLEGAIAWVLRLWVRVCVLCMWAFSGSFWVR